MRRGAWGRSLVMLVAVLLLGACRLQVDVNVSVEDDGSGLVEVVMALDEDAVERLGGDLDAAVELEDLEAAGWEVRGPTEENDGYTRIRVSKPFGTPAEAAEIVAEIAPDEGPFQDFRVERSSSFARTRWRFEGRVDFTGGLEAFGDEALAAELDGKPIGREVDELEEQLGESLSRLVTVRVGVQLPGDVESNATTQARNGAIWEAGFGEESLDMQATGTQRRTEVLVWTGLGALAAFALLLLLLIRLAMRRSDRTRGAHTSR